MFLRLTRLIASDHHRNPYYYYRFDDCEDDGHVCNDDDADGDDDGTLKALNMRVIERHFDAEKGTRGCSGYREEIIKRDLSSKTNPG